MIPSGTAHPACVNGGIEAIAPFRPGSVIPSGTAHPACVNGGIEAIAPFRPGSVIPSGTDGSLTSRVCEDRKFDGISNTTLEFGEERRDRVYRSVPTGIGDPVGKSTRI